MGDCGKVSHPALKFKISYCFHTSVQFLPLKLLHFLDSVGKLAYFANKLHRHELCPQVCPVSSSIVESRFLTKNA